MWEDRFFALQLGFVHPSVTRAANAVFWVVALVVAFPVPLPSIIPWARRVEKISAAVDIEYREGITGSHFEVGGIDRMIIPLHVSSDIA
jgi:hypothetical protein